MFEKMEESWFIDSDCIKMFQVCWFVRLLSFLFQLFFAKQNCIYGQNRAALNSVVDLTKIKQGAHTWKLNKQKYSSFFIFYMDW